MRHLRRRIPALEVSAALGFPCLRPTGVETPDGYRKKNNPLKTIKDEFFRF
ncbi:MAG: hypothetical protein M0Z50_06165 [Planctomycetia bacterium]|nr:hypothetical protein [Planctomycetia bacterium]